jgi:hypothetical protein
MKKILFICLAFAALSVQAINASEQPLARVFEQYIYESDLKNEDGRDSQLKNIIIPRLLDTYKDKNNLSFKPTDEEKSQFKVWFSKENPNHEQEVKEREQQTLERLEARAKAKNLSDEETKKLIDGYKKYAQNQPSEAELIADIMLPHWKSQVYFFKHYGGGRLLWQQGGIEAYDAFHNWLKKQEELGNFDVFVLEDREAFYRYWNTQHPSILDDEDSVEKFLNPEWRL